MNSLRGYPVMRNEYLWEKIYAALKEIERKMKAHDLTNLDKDLEYKKSLVLREIIEVINYFANSTEYSKLKYQILLSKKINQKVAAEILGIEVGSVKTIISDFDGRLRRLIGINTEENRTVDTIDKVMNCRTIDELESIKLDFWMGLKEIKGSYFRK
jgi:hypothetical protein